MFTPMENLPPTETQLQEARRFLEAVGDAWNIEDFDETLQNDTAFELWDNIATEEYTKQGGTFRQDDPNEPTDPKLFEDCQGWATELITGLSNQN